MKKVTAIAIGSQAHRLLKVGGRAQIIGSTSKGIFLMKEPRDVIFISYEAYRSPLTISLGAEDDALRASEIGESVELTPAGVILSGGAARVECGHLSPWQADFPQSPPSGFEEIAGRVKFIAGGVARERPGIGFSPLVSALLLNRREDLSAMADERAGAGAAAVMDAVTNHPPALAAALSALIGYGRGLTPSGDDLALGFLLVLNRWGGGQSSDGNGLEYLNAALIKAAESKTTTLSQNLIRLAARGEGDERQMAVVDGLMSGDPPAADCLHYTLEMGNSSGIDAFLGMAAGILWINKKSLQELISF